MESQGFDLSDYASFEKNSDLGVVLEALRSIPTPAPQNAFSALLTGSIPLSDPLRFPLTIDPPKSIPARIEVLTNTWRRIEATAYYKSLMKNSDYKRAADAFEIKLKSWAGDDVINAIMKRILFANITGGLVKSRLALKKGRMRRYADKRTSKKAMTHINALMRMANDGVRFQDGGYQLRKLKEQLTATSTVRAGNSLTPNTSFYISRLVIF